MHLHKRRLLQQLQSRKQPPEPASIRTNHTLAAHRLSQVAQTTLRNLNIVIATTSTEATEAIEDMATGALDTALMTTMAQSLHQNSRRRPTLTTIHSRKLRAHS
jgi:hypothetical protein